MYTLEYTMSGDKIKYTKGARCHAATKIIVGLCTL